MPEATDSPQLLQPQKRQADMPTPPPPRDTGLQLQRLRAQDQGLAVDTIRIGTKALRLLDLHPKVKTTTTATTSQVDPLALVQALML